MVDGGVFCRAARTHEAAGLGCEDAAVARGSDAGGFAALCDGCSSGEDSGLGAKALARAALAAWELAPRDAASDWPGLARRAWSGAGAAMRACGLDPVASPATLLALSVDAATGVARFACWGDGLVAVVDGATGAARAAWRGQSALNMPAYPAYALDDELWASFEEAGGRSCWAPVESLVCAPMSEGARHWSGEAALEPGDFVLLLSDGIDAIEGKAASEALSELAKARGPGSFIQRRASKALDAWLRAGCVLGDDFGLAALRWSAEPRLERP